MWEAHDAAQTILRSDPFEMNEQEAYEQVKALQQINQKLAKELDDLKAQNINSTIADLQSKLAAYALKEEEWNHARRTLETRQQALADQSTAARRALDLEKKLGQAGSHLKTLANENSAFTQKLDRYAKMEVEWADKSNKAKEDAAAKERDLREKVKELERRIEDAKEEAEAESSKIKAEAQEATKRVKELEEAVARANEEVETSRKTNTDLESRLAEIVSKPKSRARGPDENAVGEEVAEDASRVKELEVRCAALEKDKANGEEALRGLEAARKALAKEVKALKSGAGANTNANANANAEGGINTKEVEARVAEALDALLKDTEHTNMDPQMVPLEILGALERVRMELERRQIREREAETKAAVMLEKVKAEHAKILVEIQSSHHIVAEEKAQLESDYEALTDRLETLTSSHHQTLADLRAQHDATLADRDRLLADHRTATDKLTTLTTTHTVETANLRRQLDRVTEERTQLSKDHNAMLERLAAMKSALAPKLQADLEESRQLRQRLASLTADHADLQQTATQLRMELAATHDQLDQSSRELAQLRAHLLDSSHETARELREREDELRAAQVRLDRVQREKEEWELLAMEERGTKEQVVRRCRQLEKEAEAQKVEVGNVMKEREREAESLANLQAVLEEFQAAKESEIRFAVEGLQRQLITANTSLQEFQQRALSAEEQLEQLQRDITRARQLEKEVKEKNLQIGKLRHEAVILNEHLVEAMRRLKQESSENNVDRRLMTNLLITFLNAPRGDRKRYDTLTVMASVLQLTDEQKEQVGLIRRAGGPGSAGGIPGSPGWVTPGPRKSGELDYPAESFTDAWISYLLKESNATARQQSQSQPTSPSLLSPTGGAGILDRKSLDGRGL